MRSHQVGWICCLCLDETANSGHQVYQHFVCHQCFDQKIQQGGEELLLSDVNSVEDDGGD